MHRQRSAAGSATPDSPAATSCRRWLGSVPAAPVVRGSLPPIAGERFSPEPFSPSPSTARPAGALRPPSVRSVVSGSVHIGLLRRQSPPVRGEHLVLQLVDR